MRKGLPVQFFPQVQIAASLGTRIADSSGQYQPSLVGTSVKMLAALGVVLVVLLIVMYFAKHFLQRHGGPTRDTLVRVLGNTAVGVKKNITLVEIPGAILVVGIANDTMCLLSKIEDEKTLQQVRNPNEGSTTTPFAAHLRDFSARFRAGKDVE
jgi:flagellar protein FliO/FliZ